jgi:hypothetical protein
MDENTVGPGFHAADAHTLTYLYSGGAGLRCKPGVELIPSNHAKRVAIGHLHNQATAPEIEVCFGRVDMRNLRHVQAQPLEHNLSIDDQSPSAQLRTRIAGLFQDEHAGNEVWREPGNVQRR